MLTDTRPSYDVTASTPKLIDQTAARKKSDDIQVTVAAPHDETASTTSDEVHDIEI
jgi:hypothetical protein